MLCIKDELGQLSRMSPVQCNMTTGVTISGSTINTQTILNSPEKSISNVNFRTLPKVDSNAMDTHQRSSWVEGIIGCMRPVWTMLAKVTVNEKIKASSGKFCIILIVVKYLII